jgi:hypothetical protein
LVEGYLGALLETINVSPLVRSSSVTLDRRTLQSGLVRGELFFADGSCLYFRELIEAREQIVKRMYSYHYQRADAVMVFRYDDTPHFPSLSGFPHHKHVGTEGDVVTADTPALSDILREIEAMYPVSGIP